MVGRYRRINGLEFVQTPGDSEEQGSLACCSSWGCKELDTTEQLSNSSSNGLQPARLLLSMGFPRLEYWSGFSFPSPGDLPDPGIEPISPALQVDSLPSEPPEKTNYLPSITILLFQSPGNPPKSYCFIEHSLQTLKIHTFQRKGRYFL